MTKIQITQVKKHQMTRANFLQRNTLQKKNQTNFRRTNFQETIPFQQFLGSTGGVMYYIASDRSFSSCRRANVIAATRTTVSLACDSSGSGSTLETDTRTSRILRNTQGTSWCHYAVLERLTIGLAWQMEIVPTVSLYQGSLVILIHIVL